MKIRSRTQAYSAEATAEETQRERSDAAVNLRHECILSVSGILFTLAATVITAWEMADSLAMQASAGDWTALAAHLLFICIVAFLIYGGLVYQFTRLAYYRRRQRHCPTAQQELDSLHDLESAPTLTILVPSFREEEKVIAQTLLSAALQDYPKRRVVLLIDDPPSPVTPEDKASLAAAPPRPRQNKRRKRPPPDRFAHELAAFEKRAQKPVVDLAWEYEYLTGLLNEAATWFGDQIRQQQVANHVDALFIDQVLREHQRQLRQRAASLCDCAIRGLHELRRQHRRLAALFDVELTCFERKRYVNLSHEPNKAMNLNSYIDLVGKSFREYIGAGGLHLEQSNTARANLVIPDTDYFITLDADSILAPSYALRLIHLMEQPEHARTAVAQTPYSAIPGAPGALERIAGATTDIQYIIHQGFTAFGATFWVGANALLRRSALEEIAVTEEERGYPVTRYIQDRTVIEDTESSVDLVERGWRLYNYPQRLAYSATPPDFGSLLIQRRRWANGGLIILPKLLRYLAQGKGKLGEAFMRIHYLCSIAAVNIGLLLLLAVPFTASITSLWLPLTAAAYFLLYARDLRLVGYRTTDLFRVYALNLLLIPVNLGGVFKSLQQAWTGEKIPFGRTPKVSGRTAAAPLYLIAVYALLISWLVGAGVDLSEGRWAHGVFAAINAGFLLYAVIRFIGLRESREDIAVGLRLPAGLLARPSTNATVPDAQTMTASPQVSSTAPMRLKQLGHRMMEGVGGIPKVPWIRQHRFAAEQKRGNIASKG